MNRKIIPIVLATHVTILLLVGGGLSALGAAVSLSIPLVGTLIWLAYQKGQESVTNKKIAVNTRLINIEKISPIHFFRG